MRIEAALEELEAEFELLGDWEQRYRHVIDLGRGLAPLAESERCEANKVRGCASQVWLVTHVMPDGAEGPVLTFEGDSDAHIVRGLVAIVLALIMPMPGALLRAASPMQRPRTADRRRKSCGDSTPAESSAAYSP